MTNDYLTYLIYTAIQRKQNLSLTHIWKKKRTQNRKIFDRAYGFWLIDKVQ